MPIVIVILAFFIAMILGSIQTQRCSILKLLVSVITKVDFPDFFCLVVSNKSSIFLMIGSSLKL